MKKSFTLSVVLVTVALVLGSFVAVQAVGVSSYLKSFGSKVYQDSIVWDEGAGSFIDTLIGATAADTSRIIPIDNLEAFSAMFIYTNSQGTAGGTHALSCSLEVSIDGSNWYQPPTTPVFSTSSSADPAANSMIVYYAAGADSMIGDPNLISGLTPKTFIAASRFARLRSVQASGDADTTFLKVITFRSHKPIRY